MNVTKSVKTKIGAEKLDSGVAKSKRKSQAEKVELVLLSFQMQTGLLIECVSNITAAYSDLSVASQRKAWNLTRYISGLEVSQAQMDQVALALSASC